MPPLEIDHLRKRLLYQSQHRGMREIDLLLGTFAERALPSMSLEELQAFEERLALSDQDLYEWLCEQPAFTYPFGP